MRGTASNESDAVPSVSDMIQDGLRRASTVAPRRPVPFVVVMVTLAIGALILPVLVAPLPLMTDYPNHLTRLWLIHGGADLPFLKAIYRVNWDTLTNIGTDLLAVAAMKLVGYDAAGRMVAALTIAAAPLGGVILWSVVHGRPHWWQIAFAMLAWGMGTLDGFMSFQLSLGLALLAAAADPALSRRGLVATALGRMVLAAIIYMTHLFGVLFYAALLVGLSLGPDLRVMADRGSRTKILRSVFAIAATLVLTVLVLVVIAPSLPSAQSGTTPASAWAEILDGLRQTRVDPAHKIEGVFVGLRSYANWLDVPNLAVLGVVIATSLVARRLTVHHGLLVVVVGLLMCHAVTPTALAGAYFVDRRFAIMVPWALAVALRPDLPSQVATRLATVAVLVAALGRSGAIAWIWHERQADVASVELALADLPLDATLLPLEHHNAEWKRERIGRYMITGEPSFRHFATLAVPLRDAFVPTVFSARGKQPLEVLPPWNREIEPDGGFLASVGDLLDPDTSRLGVPGARYLQDWRERFEYALVVNADVPDKGGVTPLPDGMDLVRDAGFARLYRVSKAGR